MHGCVELLTPIVKVARHHEHGLRRYFAFNEFGQLLHLAHTAGVHQTQVHHHGMHCEPVPQGGHVQQAALLKAMIAHVMVANVSQRPTRQERVAMLTMARGGVGAVSHFITFWRQKTRLPLLRPAKGRTVKTPGLARVEKAHLLQKHQVNIQRLNGQTQVVNLQPLARTKPAHTFVNVVGGHAQRTNAGEWRLLCVVTVKRGVAFHASPGKKRGSIKTASALLGEKHLSAASRQGSQS